jgi:NADPH-dependent 2,4-dienoyl-CoA reductase/sulfur reductase-like enzyme
VSYDYLVLATGARATNDDSPWKAKGTFEEVKNLLHKTAERIKQAKHIVVAGAGATGCETSAEIAYECKDKEVVLLSADPELLAGDTIAGGVESEIKKLGVQVKKNARVEGAKPLADGKTEVSLAGGEKIVTDFYLPTMGLRPNTEFLDPKMLTERKYVDVDDFYQVKGIKDVWACGDVVSKPRAAFMQTDKQVR